MISKGISLTNISLFNACGVRAEGGSHRQFLLAPRQPGWGRIDVVLGVELHNQGLGAMGKQLQQRAAQGAAGHHKETRCSRAAWSAAAHGDQAAHQHGRQAAPMNIAVVMMPLAVDVADGSAESQATA